MPVGLECAVGRGRILVPAQIVERVENLEIVPGFPAWPRRVSGLGVCGQHVVVTVSLSPVERVVNRTASALLIQPRTGGVRWALEITAPIGLVTIDALTPNPGHSEARPRWMWTASAPSRENLLWVDIDGMIAALGGSPTLDA